MVLRAKNVRFEYPGAPFSLVIGDLRIEAGERVALVGPSGSGKTTLLGLFAGLLSPDSGELEALGAPILRLREDERRKLRLGMGLVFQDLELVAHLSALDNVLLPLVLSRRGLGSELRERAHQLLAQLGLEASLKRLPHQLSRGERQRIAVARALVHAPRLVLADEPTASLDADNAERVWTTLFQACEAADATLVASTHALPGGARFTRVLDVQSLSGRAG